MIHLLSIIFLGTISLFPAAFSPLLPMRNLSGGDRKKQCLYVGKSIEGGQMTFDRSRENSPLIEAIVGGKYSLARSLIFSDQSSVDRSGEVWVTIDQNGRISKTRIEMSPILFACLGTGKKTALIIQELLKHNANSAVRVPYEGSSAYNLLLNNQRSDLQTILDLIKALKLPNIS